MTDCIDTIASLMPSSSKFKDSDVEAIFNETIGQYFDDMEIRIEDLLDAPFLTRASGDYLDLIHGKLYNLERLPDEDDDEYRARLMFQARDGLHVQELYDLDCDVYAYTDDFNPETTLTSRNTSVTNKFLIETPSDAVEDLIKDNLLWQEIVVFL